MLDAEIPIGSCCGYVARNLKNVRKLMVIVRAVQFSLYIYRITVVSWKSMGEFFS